MSVKKTQDNTRPYTLVFDIAGLPKTPNQLLGAHWRVRAGHALKWMRAVEIAIKLNGQMPAAPLMRTRLHCTLFSSGKPMDDDNLRSRFKAPIDALVKLGLMVDDSPSHMHATYEQLKAPPGKGKIRMRIEEIT